MNITEWKLQLEIRIKNEKIYNLNVCQTANVEYKKILIQFSEVEWRNCKDYTTLYFKLANTLHYGEPIEIAVSINCPYPQNV